MNGKDKGAVILCAIVLLSAVAITWGLLNFSSSHQYNSLTGEVEKVVVRE